MDEMIDIPVSLTRKLIDNGERNDCGACPIALAVSEACPGASYVGIGTNGGLFRLHRSGETYFFEIPLEAKVFILDFDEGRPTEPIAFPISLPREIAELPGFLADESLLAPLALEPMPL